MLLKIWFHALIRRKHCEDLNTDKGIILKRAIIVTLLYGWIDIPLK
jgi:hypothetical protein